MPINMTEARERLDAISERLAELKSEQKQLEAAILDEYKDAINSAYRLKPEPFGTIRVTAGNLSLKVERKKKVEWSNAALGRVYDQITADGRDPAPFIDRTVEFNIPERRYTGWAPDVRKWFDDARTVKVGAVAIEIEEPKP